MRNELFEKLLEERINKCKDTLVVKANEYATTDRLHNFKVAGELQGCTPVKALGGMMCKHTVSVYDLINDFEEGKTIPIEMWNEKIGDSINYLLLLNALINEDMMQRTSYGSVEDVSATESSSTETTNISTRIVRI